MSLASNSIASHSSSPGSLSLLQSNASHKAELEEPQLSSLLVCSFVEKLPPRAASTRSFAAVEMGVVSRKLHSELDLGEEGIKRPWMVYMLVMLNSFYSVSESSLHSGC